jgi:uroporphyrinogen decarboxylase
MTDTLSKRERVEAALSGQDLDRVPVAAWGHLLPAEIDPVTLAEASLDFFHRYDWDWLKVNPRASLFAEAWGSRFDLHDYHNVLPRFVANPHDPIDWSTLPEVTPDHPTWAAHLQTLRTIKRGIGGAPFVMTLFSPASVLAYLAGRPTDHSLAGATRAHADALLHLIRTQPAAAHHALGVIADSLAALAVASLEAGADGIFFAITKLARQGAFTEAEFATFGKPYDFRVLAAVREARFNLLHACGSGIYWKAIQDYPVRALNWASVGQGNPDLAQARTDSDFALIGGLDELGVLQHGTPEQVAEATRRALAQGGRRKFLLAPGCCLDPSVPAANIAAFRAAVH